MVKSVIGDDTQLKLVENRLLKSPSSSQVGLVIGKLSSKLDRGFIYDLIPTPLNDAGEPPCSIIDGAGENSTSKKSSSKGRSQPESSALFVDNEWVSEHARQVSRMLLGGMKVIGVYIWVNETLFKNSTFTLCQTVRGVAEGSSPIVDSNDRLLLHISYSPLRWSCRNCSLASSSVSSSNLRPCDFKMGKVFDVLRTFGCTYHFDIRIPILQDDVTKIQTISDVLHNVIVDLTKELGNARAVIDGKLVSDDELCVSNDFHEVDLLLPLVENLCLEACIQKKVIGVVHFRGSICSMSYLNSKEPVSQALVDIKEDIIRSLRSRVEILRDEGVDHSEMSGSTSEIRDGPSQRKWFSLALPRRVFVPWLEGAYICDYIQSSETIEALKDHCSELMSIEFPTDPSDVLEPETEAPSVSASTAKDFWQVLKGDNQDRKTEDGKPTKSADFMTVIAVLVLALSIVLGLILYVRRDMQITTR